MGGHLLSWWGSSGLAALARLCQCLHRAMPRCQAPCLRPAPTEEAPCPGWAAASHPAELATFQSPHPLKVPTRGPSQLRQDRLRGGRGKRDNASKITPLKAVHPPPFLHSSPGRQRPFRERPLCIRWGQCMRRLCSWLLDSLRLECWRPPWKDSLWAAGLPWGLRAPPQCPLWSCGGVSGPLCFLSWDHICLADSYVFHRCSLPRCPFPQAAFLACLPPASIWVACLSPSNAHPP